MCRPWSAVGAVAVNVHRNCSSSVADLADALPVARLVEVVVGSIWHSTVATIALSTTLAVNAILLFRHDMPFLYCTGSLDNVPYLVKEKLRRILTYKKISFR